MEKKIKMSDKYVKALRNKLAKLLDALTGLIPVRVAASLEWRLQRTQGKGIGSSSLNEEIKTLGYFVRQLGLKRIEILDVGANTGQYGMQALLDFPDAILHSFEPGTSAYRQLLLNSDSHPNWNVYQCGLGSESEVKYLHFTTQGSASASIIDQSQVYGRELSLSRELVRIIKLDEFLLENGSVDPNILKLDIEGNELNCLFGAANSIDKFKIVQFEFGEINIDSRTYFRDFWNYFSSKGFEIYRIGRKGPIRINHYQENLENFSVTNYLAVRP